MSTAIIGGGIIGLSTAYYLSQSLSESQRPSIHIIDSSPHLLLSSSGFAGGFLALDWFTPSVRSLGALSFRLHRELAIQHDGARKWGYAGSHVYSLSIDERGVAKKGTGRRDGGTVRGEDWLLEGTSRAEVRRHDESKRDSDSAKAISGEAGDERDEMLNDDGTPTWITSQDGGTMETIALPHEAGQVEPRELCEFLIGECEKRGVEIHVSTKVVEVVRDENGVMNGVRIQRCGSTEERLTGVLKCSNLVLSAGAWTPRVFKSLFPKSKISIPIDPLSGHSLTVKSPRFRKPFLNRTLRSTGPALENSSSGETDAWMCYGIFCAPGPHWRSFAPEAFARLARNGETEIWIGGLNDASLPLPEFASDVKDKFDTESIKTLRQSLVQLTGLSREGEQLHEDDLETLREGLCFRPVSRSGRPIVAKVKEGDLGGLKTSDDGGVFVASGHGPWGISLGLGTGMVVSEMLLGTKTSADIRGLAL